MKPYCTYCTQFTIYMYVLYIQPEKNYKITAPCSARSTNTWFFVLSYYHGFNRSKDKVTHAQGWEEGTRYHVSECRLKESTCLVWETSMKGRGGEEDSFYLIILVQSQISINHKTERQFHSLNLGNPGYYVFLLYTVSPV